MKNLQYNFSYILSFILLLMVMMSTNVIADEKEKEVAFPDKYMIRLSGYYVDKAATNITILSGAGIGAGINFKDNLGGEDTDAVPRIDAYYRFNARHRIDFSSFSINRVGSKTLDIDLTIGDETFQSTDTINSRIKYTVYKIGYAYSFYHSPEVELSLLTGLNFTSYDVNYSLDSGAQASAQDVTAPLPMFGLSFGYKISENWSFHYRSESFFVELGSKIKGVLLSYDLDVEYRLFENFALGLGISRVSSDVSVNDGDWVGSIEDSHRGFKFYGSLYF